MVGLVWTGYKTRVFLQGLLVVEKDWGPCKTFEDTRPGPPELVNQPAPRST